MKVFTNESLSNTAGVLNGRTHKIFVSTTSGLQLYSGTILQHRDLKKKDRFYIIND